jgi:heme exporter protein D
MQWSSLSEFLTMGGYALYVWGSVAACAAVVTVEPWLISRRRARIVRDIRAHHEALEATP